MIERLYHFLYSMGYSEPLHPSMVHIPMGLVIGAFLLGLLSLFLRHRMMGRAAWYAIVMSFIFLFPSALLGYMDWQHFFAAGWLFQIKMKLLLAALFLVLACIALIKGRKEETTSAGVAVLYALCVLAVAGLGYFGGHLVYVGRAPEGPADLKAGEVLFLGNCSGCHPYGGNIVDQEARIWGSPEVKTTERFLRWMRDPRLDNGARGIMPPFPPSKLSDAQTTELRRYIVKVTALENSLPACGIAIPRIVVRTAPVSVEKGKQLFETNCTGCHTVKGTETIVGPGLKGILKRKMLPVGDMAATPENVFRQLRCPYAEMPSLAKKLTDDQVFDLIAYLNTR